MQRRVGEGTACNVKYEAVDSAWLGFRIVNFVNDHGSGGIDRGTFEGNVSVVAGQPVVEGEWKYTGGQGSFAGITGGGTFKTKLTSPTAVEATWDGTYELAAARAKAV